MIQNMADLAFPSNYTRCSMKNVIVVFCIVALSAAAFAQPMAGTGTGRGNGPMAGREGRSNLIARLNLSEDQQAQFDKMRIDIQKKQTLIQSKIRIARLEMQELYNAATPDRNAIEKKMRDISDLQLQTKLNHLDHMFAVKGILNADQQKIWKQHMQAMGEGGLMRHRMMDRDGDSDRPARRRIERRIEGDGE